jgi:hypothetical protein
MIGQVGWTTRNRAFKQTLLQIIKEILILGRQEGYRLAFLTGTT